MPAKKQTTRKSTTRPVKRKKPGKKYELPEADNRVEEPAIEYTTKIRAIGNSKGLILNNQLLDIAGFLSDQDVLIRAVNGRLIIEQVKKPAVNTDLSTWEKQLKAAIKAGAKPEGDLFEGIENEFDSKEW